MYEAQTEGVIIRATPRFMESESDLSAPRYVWAYTISIENTAPRPVQLLNRHWRITDSAGLTHEVKGAGVVGQQPVIRPGETFEYTSACPLTEPSGVMMGSYEMKWIDDGALFEATVPAFALDSPHANRLAN
jgi:ApaG protein